MDKMFGITVENVNDLSIWTRLLYANDIRYFIEPDEVDGEITYLIYMEDTKNWSRNYSILKRQFDVFKETSKPFVKM